MKAYVVTVFLLPLFGSFYAMVWKFVPVLLQIKLGEMECVMFFDPV